MFFIIIIIITIVNPKQNRFIVVLGNGVNEEH